MSPGESVGVALAREFAEELGLAVTVGPYLGAVECRYPASRPTNHEINQVFAVGLLDPPQPREPAPGSPEAETTEPREGSWAGRGLEPGPASREGHLEFWWCPVERLPEFGLLPTPMRDIADRARRAGAAGGAVVWSGTFED